LYFTQSQEEGVNEANLSFFKGCVKSLSRCWSKETSAYRDWSPANPALGQCAVTVLVLQDLFGGTIQRRLVIPPGHTVPNEQPQSHYTLLIDGLEYDPTRQQFPEGTSFTDPVPWTRQQMLWTYPRTMERYALLMLSLTLFLLEDSTY
jgi:hypothetical protein